MLELLFLTGQAASALLLLYGGYLAFFHWIAAVRAAVPGAEETPAGSARSQVR